ncbi:glycosyltransferase [Cerasicoccus fimbriatus]|uniref:glycosyltransferase n=1 Tax=Cerasicoccus fimbriatus TaxID=3014554 RepID=UPI0022B5A1E1|nr:glycosyltransferase [Cerasicoccus sp. TK19100]
MSGTALEPISQPVVDQSTEATKPQVDAPVIQAATTGENHSAQLKIAYLFTTFPVTSETFLQREVRVMASQGVEVEIHSLWLGEKEWEGIPIKYFRHRWLLKLLYLLPKHIFRSPGVFRELGENLLKFDMPSLLNLGETMRGIGCAIVLADEFKRKKPDVFHCVWATMPATTGWVLSRLTGVPYTMGAHAYDVFKKEGDWLLTPKLKEALIVHTTTDSARRHLIAKGASKDKVLLIRRGLDQFPPCKVPRTNRRPLRILSVGRLVPKKGYHRQLEIFRQLANDGFAFEARIVGGGRLEDSLRQRHAELNLQNHVDLVGRRPFNEVKKHYDWADVLIFTGIVAPDGDRDGLPNVIPEAMAMGLPVVTSPVSGTIEAIHHEETGFIARNDDYEAWKRALTTLQSDDETFHRIRGAARTWVLENYDNQVNAASLATRLKDSIKARVCSTKSLGER